ncbi:MAG: hypothetical protein ACRDRN_13295 [Sciscionella sp.]
MTWQRTDSAAPTSTEPTQADATVRCGEHGALYFGAAITLLLLAPYLSTRAELAVDGFAALAGGGWCAANFWRCRHAHCVITATGWLTLTVFASVEAALGHSLIGGNEQLVFLAVLLLALAFEGAWYLTHGSNAIVSPDASTDRSTR